MPAGFIVMLVLFALSCTNTKDGTAYRVYHNTTSYFNGYYNANEAVKKGVGKIKSAHKEDYDVILPLFIYGTEETAKSAYAEMEKAIEKSSRVIEKHELKPTREKPRKHPQLNKWMDDNLLLIGQAHFYKRSYYKAENIFNIVSRKYNDPAIQMRANTWLARDLIEMKEYGKSAGALNRVDVGAKINDKYKAEYYMVFADHYLHQNDLPKAAAKLEEALKYIHRKRDRARPLFILAQINQALGKCSDAQTYYKAVEASRPPYELKFYSKINRAVSFCRQGMSSDEIRRELMKMLRDEKNNDYKYQIYYALGELDLEEQKRDEAVSDYKKSLSETAADNKKHKAKTFLRLADLYFTERQYESAQMYYDSTLKNINDTHLRYKEIKARAECLTELIGYLNTIEGNDSVVKLCNMSEDQLNKELKRIQKQIADEIAEEERRAEEAAQNPTSGGDSGGITADFWVYNAAMKKKGRDNFIKYWGDRKLEDNWRRKSKPQTFSEDEPETTTAGEGIPAESVKREVPSIEELKSTLPCGDEAKMSQATASVAEAYYLAGVVYKEKLDDKDNAINSWEQLVTNIDDSDFHPTAHYQLFRTYLAKEQQEGYSNPMCATCNSRYWGNRIKELYPGSEWARLVDNPEYLDIKELTEAQERAAYELVYNDYVLRNYPQVIGSCNYVIENQKNNHLLCKYRLLRAIATGYTDAPMGIKEAYQRELNEVVQKCPGSEEATRASELLAALNKGSSSSAPKDPGKVPESSGEEEQVKPETENPFTFDPNSEHYFVAIIPVKNGDMNAIKAEAADFNLANYNSLSLKVTSNLFDKTNHVMLIKPFKNKDEAMDYLGFFTSNAGELPQVHAAEPNMFIISKMNYIILFKSKDINQYLEFFHQYY